MRVMCIHNVTLMIFECRSKSYVQAAYTSPRDLKVLPAYLAVSNAINESNLKLSLQNQASDI